MREESGWKTGIVSEISEIGNKKKERKGKKERKNDENRRKRRKKGFAWSDWRTERLTDWHLFTFLLFCSFCGVNPSFGTSRASTFVLFLSCCWTILYPCATKEKQSSFLPSFLPSSIPSFLAKLNKQMDRVRDAMESKHQQQTGYFEACRFSNTHTQPHLNLAISGLIGAEDSKMSLMDILQCLCFLGSGLARCRLPLKATAKCMLNILARPTTRNDILYACCGLGLLQPNCS